MAILKQKSTSHLLHPCGYGNYVDRHECKEEFEKKQKTNKKKQKTNKKKQKTNKKKQAEDK